MAELSSIDIKTFRSKLGLTQDEFAELLGISRMTVSTYESGKKLAPRKLCNKIIESAKAHDYSFDFDKDRDKKYNEHMMDILKNINDSKMALAKAENQIFNITSGQQ